MMVAAARAAGTDTLLVVRVFEGTDSAGNLSLRGDWSNNRVRRFARDPLSFILMEGRDSQANVRLQGEYRLASRLTVSLISARTRQQDLLGLSFSRLNDHALRVNWSPGKSNGSAGQEQGGIVLSFEIRRTKTVSGAARESDTLFSLLLNDARLWNWR
jgi:hypothetical protein